MVGAQLPGIHQSGNGPKRVGRQAQGFFDKNGAPPWAWDIAKYCLDFKTGQPRHFPAGTYQAQMDARYGAVELQLMDTVWRIWRTATVDMNQWAADGDEVYIIEWLNSDPIDDTTTNGMIEDMWANA